MTCRVDCREGRASSKSTSCRWCSAFRRGNLCICRPATLSRRRTAFCSSRAERSRSTWAVRWGLWDRALSAWASWAPLWRRVTRFSRSHLSSLRTRTCPWVWCRAAVAACFWLQVERICDRSGNGVECKSSTCSGRKWSRRSPCSRRCTRRTSICRTWTRVELAAFSRRQAGDRRWPDTCGCSRWRALCRRAASTCSTWWAKSPSDCSCRRRSVGRHAQGQLDCFPSLCSLRSFSHSSHSCAFVVHVSKRWVFNETFKLQAHASNAKKHACIAYIDTRALIQRLSSIYYYNWNFICEHKL